MHLAVCVAHLRSQGAGQRRGHRAVRRRAAAAAALWLPVRHGAPGGGHARGHRVQHAQDLGALTQHPLQGCQFERQQPTRGDVPLEAEPHAATDVLARCAPHQRVPPRLCVRRETNRVSRWTEGRCAAELALLALLLTLLFDCTFWQIQQTASECQSIQNPTQVRACSKE